MVVGLHRVFSAGGSSGSINLFPTLFFTFDESIGLELHSLLVQHVFKGFIFALHRVVWVAHRVLDYWRAADT